MSSEVPQPVVADSNANGKTDPGAVTPTKTVIEVTNVARDENGKYVPARALELIPEVVPILHLFLRGQMKEADDAVKGGDPAAETLYYTIGQTLIEAFKSFMSFEDDDLSNSIGLAKHSAAISTTHRRNAQSSFGRVTGFIRSAASGTGWIKGMTNVERHAELTYQESILLRAILGIMYSGDWFAFVKEALALRSANIAYKNMSEFVRQADKAAGGFDKSIDAHFRSGVSFGDGVNELVLSLLPSRVLAFVHLLGYDGDRTQALTTLYSVGGWKAGQKEPEVGADEEGVRRPIADIFLLIFHLILSNYTYKGVDLDMCENILNWNFKRYPKGAFYLFSQGRLHECRSRPDVAVGYYEEMIAECQLEFKSLHNISLWQLGICTLSLNDMDAGIKRWRELLEAANWSKCAYTYALASCLYCKGGEENLAEAKKLMDEVPGLMQRIAGRSIPLEKYAARKAKKFTKQGDRLLLPAMELGYHFLSITRSPRNVLVNSMLPQVEAALEKINAHIEKPKEYENGVYFWDDYALANFLHAVILRYAVTPNDDAHPAEEDKNIPTPENASEKSAQAFQNVLDNANKIEVDHWIVYYTHYELGLLSASTGKRDDTKKHFDLVLSGKELVKKSEKGKYSLESNLLMRTHAAMDHLGFQV